MAHGPKGSQWRDSDLLLICELYDAGLTLSQIAGEVGSVVGRKISRGAVQGLIQRMELGGRAI